MREIMTSEQVADYLATGDQRLLDVKEHAGAQTVSPRVLIAILESQPESGSPRNEVAYFYSTTPVPPSLSDPP